MVLFSGYWPDYVAMLLVVRQLSSDVIGCEDS